MPCRLAPYATALALLLATAPFAHADKPRKPTPPLPAAQYVSHDAHAKEHVTIAADPGDSKDTAPHTRLDYLGHGLMPIRIIITNDSGQALSLDDARILFVSAGNVTENAASDDELERRLFQMKSVRTSPVPLGPLPPFPIHHKSVDKQITDDENDFGFKSTTIPPHTTAAGWLYYDVQDFDQPVLQGATVELRKVRWAATNQALDTFEIPLKPITDTSAKTNSTDH
jgi:hypothetical protein